jgi:hypothetical protein
MALLVRGWARVEPGLLPACRSVGQFRRAPARLDAITLFSSRAHGDCGVPVGTPCPSDARDLHLELATEVPVLPRGHDSADHWATATDTHHYPLKPTKQEPSGRPITAPELQGQTSRKGPWNSSAQLTTRPPLERLPSALSECEAVPTLQLLAALSCAPLL